METLRLLIIIIVIVISCTTAILVIIMNVHHTPISQFDRTDYETQQIYSICQNPEITSKGNDVFVTCHHPVNHTNNGYFDLPLPTYKRVVCQSTYGCSGQYSYMLQIPQNLLTESQKQQAINVTLNATGLKQKYPNIQVGSFQIQSHADQWFAEINFLIPHCNWYPNSRVNLNTMQVLQSVDLQQGSGC